MRLNTGLLLFWLIVGVLIGSLILVLVHDPFSSPPFKEEVSDVTAIVLSSMIILAVITGFYFIEMDQGKELLKVTF